MYVDLFAWDDEDDLNGNYRHIVDTDEVTVEEFEQIIRDHQGGPDAYSDSSGFPIIFGTTADGKRIAVVYEDESGSDFVIIRPRTAYPVPDYGG